VNFLQKKGERLQVVDDIVGSFKGIGLSELISYPTGFYLLGGLLFLYLLFKSPSKRTLRRDSERWEKFLELRSNALSSRILYIKKIRQYAQTGTKAIVADLSSGKIIGAWFPDKRMYSGNIVLAEGDFGHGHHHDEEVFYVSRLHKSLPKAVLKNWERYHSVYFTCCA
jgi:hypothetical protein